MSVSTTSRRDEMLDKVRKLFAKADSVAGTPEADIFNAKAYQLISKYGIEETEARQQEESGPAEIVTVDFDLTGKFTTERRMLLQILAKALHCSPLWLTASTGDRDIVCGADIHVDRVRILFSMLAPQMLAGAKAVRPHAGSRVGVVAYRKSWMRGFYQEVKIRLTEAEKAATDASQASTALALVDDAKRADLALRQEFTGRIVSKRTRGRNDNTAHNLGRQAGRNVNLGGTSLGGRRAIGV